MLPGLFAIMALLVVPPPAVPRFSCDAAHRALLWELDGTTLRADGDGLTLLATPIASPARRVAPARGTDGDGDVLCLCQSDRGPWTLVRRNNDVWLVAPESGPPGDAEDAAKTPPAYDFGAALLVAMGSPSSTMRAIDRAFAMAVRHGLAVHVAMVSLAMADGRPEVRAWAAGVAAADPADAATARLRALSADPASDVRRAALDAVGRAAPLLPAAVASLRLALFRDDVEQDIAWEARDRLLDRAADLALAGASTEYKIDALTILLTRCRRDGATAVQAALRLLVADNDPAVRDAAALLERCVSH